MPGFKSICPRYSEDCEENVFRISARDMDNQMGSSNLTLGSMIGIAIAGAAVIFVAAILLLVFHARRKDSRKRKQIAEDIQTTEEQVNFKAFMGSNGPSTRNFDPSMPPNGWTVSDPYSGIVNSTGGAPSIREPPAAKVRTSSESKTSFKQGVRDSWPLSKVTNIALSLLPGQQPTMTLNQVAPPGYVVQPESKWPRRNSSRSSRSSRNSKTKVAAPSPEHVFVPPSHSPTKSPTRRPRNQRRSTSETQLTTILRSTSQRLNAAKKQTLTRTLTTFAKLPGSPPKEPLPNPPLKKQTNESSEVLIETSFFESPGSSVYEAFMAKTPSPDKPDGKDSSHKRDKSATSSIVSDDSLCEMATPDLVIPGLLTSPSKQSRIVVQEDPSTEKIPVPQDEPKEKDVPVAQMHRMTIADLDTSAQNKKSRVSTTAFGKHRSFQGQMNITSGPHRISLAGDPFYSHVKSSKPVFPKTDLQGPRPLYVRKATFGQEATTERPLSYISPLRNISGNAQTPPKSEQTGPSSGETSERNPFQWSPREAMQERPRGLSPKRNGSKRKGHKRSNVIRMSNLPSRPTSVLSVDVVPEEPEEDPSILKFNIPKTAPLRLVSPSKSPSPSPSAASRRHNGRPPSVPTFNPMLTIPDLSSPLSKPDNTSDAENTSPTASSPTLSTTNYYLNSSPTNSEEDFYTSKEPAKITRNPSHHARNHSELPRPPAIPPRAKNHRYSADAVLRLKSLTKLTSFPPPDLSPNIGLTRPPSTIIVSPSNIIVSPSSLSASSPTLLAPPLLTIPIPGHLTGPRSPPVKPSTSPPPRESLHNSICMLRRMNSEVSHYSNAESDTSPGLSPDLPTARKFASSVSYTYSPSVKKSTDLSRIRSRGSKHYLSLGPTDSMRRERGRASLGTSGAGAGSMKRTNRPMGIKGARDSQDMFLDHRRRHMQSDFTEAELKTVREVANPPVNSKSPNALNFRFPVLTRNGEIMDGVEEGDEGGVDDTPSKRSDTRGLEVKGKRWSDAMTKPVVESVRRESRMEYPSPKTPPILRWEGGAGVGRLEKNAIGTVFTGDGRSKKEGISPGRPESLGLYDEDGFLKSSPFKMKESPGGNI